MAFDDVPRIGACKALEMAINPTLTPAEYLAFERQQSDTRHEYLDGQITAMGGASREHNLIVGNAFASLHVQLRGRGCEVYSNDMRVHIPATGLYTYPDLAALCEAPVFEGDQFDTLLNPSVIIEVLSASTEAYDRGVKFAHYRSIESLQAYVLIAQDRPHIELFERGAGGRWVLSEAKGLDGRLELASLGCVLELSEVYERIFDALP
jgi:Uma2 family endonuclease